MCFLLFAGGMTLSLLTLLHPACVSAENAGSQRALRRTLSWPLRGVSRCTYTDELSCSSTRRLPSLPRAGGVSLYEGFLEFPQPDLSRPANLPCDKLERQAEAVNLKEASTTGSATLRRVDSLRWKRVSATTDMTQKSEGWSEGAEAASGKEIFTHIPVMADEVLHFLLRGDAEKPAGNISEPRVFVDCTVGGGGFASLLHAKLKSKVRRLQTKCQIAMAGN